jgi:tight adherence protein B
MAGLIVAATVVLAALVGRSAFDASRRTAARRRLGHGRAPRVLASLPPRWQRRRDARQLVDELPAVLEEIARALRAGSSLRQACHDAAQGPTAARRWLASAMARAERGSALAAVFGSWATGAAAAEVRIAAGALALAASAGGSQARAVDGIALTLRERRAAAAEVHSHSAQGRLSAVVIGGLPVAFLAWAALTDRRTLAFLVSAPAGWASLASGVALEAVGVVWMRHILRAAAP